MSSKDFKTKFSSGALTRREMNNSGFGGIDLTKSADDPVSPIKIEKLRRSFEVGAICRRDFMAGALALGASLTAASAVLDKAAAATPKRGGRLRTGMTGGATSDVMDPGRISDSYMINVQFGQLRNGLTGLAPNGELIGELAESWGASDDIRTWSFKIRKGVEFHNGKTLDSQDVVDSLNHHLGPDSKSAAKGILGGVESVETDGKQGVIVRLSEGDADLPVLMSDYHLLVCPSNGDGTVDWQSGIGTGGYRLVDHEPGLRTLTKRNPNYWKASAAYFDEVETIGIADVNARTTALKTGEVDCINKVEAKTVHLLKKVSGIVVRTTAGNKQITLPMRTDTPPFDNNDVRLALKLIVDREQWLRVVARGLGELGNDNPIGPANTYRATVEELPQRVYDPDQAKYHLKKAGLDSLKVKFYASETGFSGAIDAGQLMRETARPAGIDIELVREPDDGYWSNVWMKKPWVASYWAGRPTENWIFSQIYSEGASWNETFWKNDRFNELLLLGRAESDPTNRRAIYVEMQTIVNMEGGACLPLFLSYIFAHSDRLAVPEVIGNDNGMDGHKNAERWWFA